MKIGHNIILAVSIALLPFILTPATAQQREGYTRHVVQWYENLDKIANTYGVPADILMKVNGLQDSSVKTRQELWIPVNESYWPGAKQNASDSLMAGTSPMPVQEEEVYTPKPVNKIRFTLLLPFHSDNQRENANNLDFYSGVLLATKTMGEKGLNIDVDVIDFSESDRHPIHFKNFILGPIKSKDLEQSISELDDSITVVSPLDSRASAFVKSHRNFVQIPTIRSNQYFHACYWAKEIAAQDSLSQDFIILTNQKDSVESRSASAVLDSLGIRYKVCICGVESDIPQWNSVYNPKNPTNVILAMTNEAILNNTLRFLGTVKGDIVVYSNNKILSFDTILTENVHRAKTHVLCPYYVDYNDEATQKFVHDYHLFFHTEPSQFAFHGYDLTCYMIETYAKYGKNWQYLIQDEAECDMLQASFKLERIENGGLINTAIRRVQYNDDYSIDLVVK